MTTWRSNTYFSHFVSPFCSDDVFDEIKFTVNYNKVSHGFEERLRITNLVELLQWYSFFFVLIIETKIENYYNYVASSSDSKVHDRKTKEVMKRKKNDSGSIKLMNWCVSKKLCNPSFCVSFPELGLEIILPCLQHQTLCVNTYSLINSNDQPS